MLLNRVPYPLNDGGAIAIQSSIRGYISAGCEVYALAMNTNRHRVDEEKCKDVFAACKQASTVYIDNRIKPVGALVNLFSMQSYIISRFASVSFSQKLSSLLQQYAFDVVHFDTLSTLLYLDVVQKHTTAKTVYRAHNVEHVIWQRAMENESNLLKRWYLRIQSERLKRFEVEQVKKVDVVLPISRDDESYFHSLMPEKPVWLVPAGMEIAEQLPPPSDKQNLFFIGSFDWLPNVQGIEWFFKNIWNDIHREFPSLSLVIAGKKMPTHIASLRIANVEPVGEVADAREFILNNGIMIVPLVSGSGIRVKIVEAMALGKVIIATTIAAEGLGATPGENILIADTSAEFIREITHCLNDRAFARQIGENAHTFALNNFQNKRIFERLTATYRQLT